MAKVALHFTPGYGVAGWKETRVLAEYGSSKSAQYTTYPLHELQQAGCCPLPAATCAILRQVDLDHVSRSVGEEAGKSMKKLAWMYVDSERQIHLIGAQLTQLWYLHSASAAFLA